MPIVSLAWIWILLDFTQSFRKKAPKVWKSAPRCCRREMRRVQHFSIISLPFPSISSSHNKRKNIRLNRKTALSDDSAMYWPPNRKIRSRTSFIVVPKCSSPQPEFRTCPVKIAKANSKQTIISDTLPPRRRRRPESFGQPKHEAQNKNNTNDAFVHQNDKRKVRFSHFLSPGIQSSCTVGFSHRYPAGICSF